MPIGFPLFSQSLCATVSLALAILAAAVGWTLISSISALERVISGPSPAFLVFSVISPELPVETGFVLPERSYFSINEFTFFPLVLGSADNAVLANPLNLSCFLTGSVIESSSRSCSFVKVISGKSSPVLGLIVKLSTAVLELISIFLKAPFLVDFPRPPNLAIFVAPTRPLANALHSWTERFPSLASLSTSGIAVVAPRRESPWIINLYFFAILEATLAAWAPDPNPGSIETISIPALSPAVPKSLHWNPSLEISAYNPALVPSSPEIPPAIGIEPSPTEIISANKPPRSAQSASVNLPSPSFTFAPIFAACLESLILIFVDLVLAVDPEAFANPPPGANFLITPPCFWEVTCWFWVSSFGAAWSIASFATL